MSRTDWPREGLAAYTSNPLKNPLWVRGNCIVKEKFYMRRKAGATVVIERPTAEGVYDFWYALGDQGQAVYHRDELIDPTEYEQSLTAGLDRQIRDLFSKYGSAQLLRSVASAFREVEESASIYPTLANIIDGLADLEP